MNVIMRILGKLVKWLFLAFFKLVHPLRVRSEVVFVDPETLINYVRLYRLWNWGR